jgi:hypothetical protein
MRTATTIELSSPSLVFEKLKIGEMFMHGTDKERVYIKTSSTNEGNCVSLASSSAGIHGYCGAHDQVTLVKQANFVV